MEESENAGIKEKMNEISLSILSLESLMHRVDENKNNLELQQELVLQTNAISRKIETVQREIYQQPSPPSPQSKRKLDSLYSKMQDVRSHVDIHFKREGERKREEEERERLMGNSARFRQRTIKENEHLVNQSLNNSKSIAIDLIQEGRSLVDELSQQNSMLKKANQKLLDIGSILGVNTSIMNTIERRIKQDAFLLYGGMILITLLVFFLYYYL